MSELPRSTWRLLKTPPAPGPWNMAVDEAILQASVQGRVAPTLRLYAWEPACLSLGYAQPVSDVDKDKLEKHGWDIVRRATGGRAILHTDELTYSVSGPEDEPRLAGDILTSYRRLSQALLHALQALSLPVQVLPKEQAPTGPQTEPVCFEIPSNYEITVDGKKLVGSAQARRARGVLQHGTLPLTGDLARITQALVFESGEARTRAAERLLSRAATVETVLGRKVTWEETAAAFERAFAETLNLDLQPGELTPWEIAAVEKLMVEKYDHPGWTEKL